MPNPSGANQFAQQPAYGDVKRLTELQQGAPMSGAPAAAHAVNAPRRSQKRATRRTAPKAQAQAQAAEQMVPPPALPPDVQQQVSRFWMDAAGIPGASDLVRHYAIRAQAQAQGGS